MDSVLAEARNVFAQLNASPEEVTFAMTQLTRWCLDDEFLAYRPQIRAMAQNQRWGQLYDAFVQHVGSGPEGFAVR